MSVKHNLRCEKSKKKQFRRFLSEVNGKSWNQIKATLHMFVGGDKVSFGLGQLLKGVSFLYAFAMLLSDKRTQASDLYQPGAASVNADIG